MLPSLCSAKRSNLREDFLFSFLLFIYFVINISQPQPLLPSHLPSFRNFPLSQIHSSSIFLQKRTGFPGISTEHGITRLCGSHFTDGILQQRSFEHLVHHTASGITMTNAILNLPSIFDLQ